MNTENAVRDLIYKAWAEWRKSPDALKFAQITGYEDAAAFPRLFEAGYRAALQSQSNTDGWVMVPTMPTDTQLDRAVSFALNVQISGSYNWTMYMRDVYLRMLSAAPKAPQQVSNIPQDGKLPEQRDLLRVYVEHGFICVRTSDEKLIANHRIDALQPYQFFEIPGTTAPPQQQEQSVEAVAPIGYIRLQNGKVDWDENCLSATEGGTLFGYEGKDGYTESPVYLESGQRVGSAALYTLLEYCERAEDCQMGTLAIDLVQRLVNEALSTTTPTATASQASREEQMVSLRTDESGNPTVWCDPEIADLVDALNTGSLATVASCSGHGHRPGRVSLADGRELLILNADQVEKVEALFPVDVNGAVQTKFIDVWKKYMPAPTTHEMQTYRWCETFWNEGRKLGIPE